VAGSPDKSRRGIDAALAVACVGTKATDPVGRFLCGLSYPLASALGYLGAIIKRRIAVPLIGCICILICAGDAIPQGTRDIIIVNMALDEPSLPDIGRHGAFTTVLARLLELVVEKQKSQLCTVSSEVDFPDLRLSLQLAASASSAKPCLAKIREIVLGANLSNADFSTAVGRAIDRFRPISLESGDFKGASLWPTRVRVVGQQALVQLYAHDPVLEPLLTMYDQLTSVENDYAGFVLWLERQRASKRVGFYPNLDRGALSDWDGDLRTRSTRPLLRRPDIGDSGEIHVRAPNVGGRSFVLVRCDSARDSCLDVIARAFCFKTAEQMGAAAASSQINPRASLQCRPIGVFGFAGWMIAESDDEALVRWLKDELAAKRPGSLDLDGSSIEYVVLVTTN